ncbi:MAG: type II toxin-antitoxin system RelE/ParE family toxin [Candidatus Liptonbacteria bacterium]|nr:type II toxin-antitoxin system RelE/ParE family toxin [Candidatus Liptonbacteria bacterium]
MSFAVHVAKSAKKHLSRFPKNDKGRIVNALDELSKDPYSGDIEKLGGQENSWRRRVGNYRIFYDIRIDLKLIEVTEINRRTSSTY